VFSLVGTKGRLVEEFFHARNLMAQRPDQ
jgi:hypothetical protein